MKLRPEEISSVLADELKKYGRDLEVESVGTILQVGDGIARIYGLQDVMAGELVKFPGDIMGIVLNLEEDSVGVAILGDDTHIKEGDQVTRTGAIGIGLAIVGCGTIGRIRAELALENDEEIEAATALTEALKLAPQQARVLEHELHQGTVGGFTQGKDTGVGRVLVPTVGVVLVEHHTLAVVLVPGAIAILVHRRPGRGDGRTHGPLDRGAWLDLQSGPRSEPSAGLPFERPQGGYCQVVPQLDPSTPRDLDLAASLLQRVIRQDPDSFDPYLQLGILLRLGHAALLGAATALLALLLALLRVLRAVLRAASVRMVGYRRASPG